MNVNEWNDASEEVIDSKISAGLKNLTFVFAIIIEENTANLSGTHIRLVQLKRSSQSSEEQHVTHSTDTVEQDLVSALSYLS